MLFDYNKWNNEAITEWSYTIEITSFSIDLAMAEYVITKRNNDAVKELQS